MDGAGIGFSPIGDQADLHFPGDLEAQRLWGCAASIFMRGKAAGTAPGPPFFPYEEHDRRVAIQLPG